MIHKELRAEFSLLRVIPLLFAHRWSSTILDHLIRRIQVGKNIKGLECSEVMISSRSDEYQIRTRIYKPVNCEGPLPVLLYIHGGGYIFGCPEMDGRYYKRFIETRPCIIIAPDYRKAYTKPYPAALNDCYDTLVWAKNHAEELDVSDSKFMVCGRSAGGGLTAAITLLNRDRGEVDIAFQMPLYPMIDDTQPDDDKRYIISSVWDSRSNKVGWDAYLRDTKNQGQEIPSYAAPTRNSDYRNFPPTISFVGDMEPFHKETLDYMRDIEAAGIPTEFKEYKGCYHGFDVSSANKTIVKDALDFTYNSFAKYYDKYVL